MKGLGLFAAVSVPTLTLGEEGNGYNQAYVVKELGGDSEFLWGAATAAAQIEGSAEVDGKQRSIWDDFCDSIPAQTGDTTDPKFKKTCGQVPKGGDRSKWTTLNVTDDFYTKYEDDLEMLAGYNMNAMRVSISWPRLMPFDKKTGKHKLNPKGKEFYSNVFKVMKEKGITPFVTLFHWDLPNDLSWISTPSVVEAFADYAELAFKSFPEVKNWATFNEPNSICSLGYAVAAFAPGHASKHGHIDCAHNILKSHAMAVKRYRALQVSDGKIGIVLDYKWAYPEDPNSEDDKKAAKLDTDNVLGVWAEPIFLTGDYPQSMRDYYGTALGKFTDDEKMSLKGSADFFGLNTYGGKKAKWTNKTYDEHVDGDDMAERYTYSPCDETNHPGAKDSLVDPDFECGAASSWLWAKPSAIYHYLRHVSRTLKVKNIYVTEFGVDLPEEGAMTVDESVKDAHRVDYYQRFLMQIARAKEAKVGVKGIFAWSLMDNFEWGDGLNFRFGITYVDFNSDDLTRTPKDSAKFWKALIGDMSPSKNIVELAESVPTLSTLVAAVVAGDLAETLSQPGPFTVFAPTNDAFNALPEGVLNSLMKPANKDQLSDILKFHVLPAQVFSTDLSKFQKVKTVEGKNVRVYKSKKNGVRVTPDVSKTSAHYNKVTAADNKASNGVVHIIDGVLLPPSAPAPKTTNIPGGHEYAQCGGKEFKGLTKCNAGLECVKQNDYYSQCQKPTPTTESPFITV